MKESSPENSSIPLWLEKMRHISSWESRKPETSVQSAPKKASVAVIFSGDAHAQTLPEDARLILTKRPSSLRKHSGQISFPGGSKDPTDDDDIVTALRETYEEIGVEPQELQLVTHFSAWHVPPSNFLVTPVVFYKKKHETLHVTNPVEVERILQPTVRELLQPQSRHLYAIAGFTTSSFIWRDEIIWGFTAGVLDRLFYHMGWEIPWDKKPKPAPKIF